MDADRGDKPRSNTLSWLAIIAAACLVYFTGLGHESIWYDEAYSHIITDYPLAQILNNIGYDNHPPLYYLLLRISKLVFGASPAGLRALSAVAAVGLVALGAGPVRRIAGDRGGIIYAFIILFTPAFLIYAHEARMYTLAMLAVTAGVLYGFLAARDDHKRDWALFALATLAAAYLHYYGLLAASFTHLFILVWLLRQKRERIKSYLTAAAMVVVGYLPWLVVLLRQVLDVDRGFWLGPVTLQEVLLALIQPFAYKEFFPTILPTVYIAVIFSFAAIVYALVIAKKRKDTDQCTLLLLSLTVYFGTMIAAILASILLAPIFYSRYMLVPAGVLMLMVAIGISLDPGRYKRLAAVIIFGLLNVLTLKDIYTQYFNHPMKQLAAELGDEIQPGDLIITSDSYSMGPSLYYFPQAVHYYSNNSIEAEWGHVLVPFAPYIHNDQDLEQLLDDHDSFWYITCNTGLSKQISAILAGASGWQETIAARKFSTPYSYVEFKAAKYEHTGKADTRQLGTLIVHITNIRPVGNLLVVLNDQGPLDGSVPPFRYEVINASAEELTYTFTGVEYGEYVLVIAHDENKNFHHDMDSSGKFPVEGVFFLGMENLDPELGALDFTFDKFKFTFNEPERTIEAPMVYPPFIAPDNQ